MKETIQRGFFDLRKIISRPARFALSCAIRFLERPLMDDGDMSRAFKVDAQPVGDLDVPMDSPAIHRLIEEVRAETVDVPRSYNRTFNRHNR